MARVEGTFTVDSWQPTPIDEAEGAKITRVSLTKTFFGGLEGGTSTTDILTAMADQLGSAAYAGFERFKGVVDGREGTFVLHHNATSEGGENSLSWSILPGSGTGQLEGITGKGQINVDEDGTHRFSLEYEL